MIEIVAKFAVVSTKKAAFLSAAERLVRSSLQEEGCLSYRLLQAVENTNQFVFLEEWQDQKTIALHNASPHFQSFSDETAAYLVAAPEITLYQPV